MLTENQKTDIRVLQALFTDIRFEAIFNAIDRLHDAAASGTLHELTNLPDQEVIGWLRDIIYTANETIRELEGQSTDLDWVGPLSQALNGHTHKLVSRRRGTQAG
jgi:hypothetical protein